jgi:metallo-beta-lactamase class B
LFEYPAVFGKAGVFSPAYWFNPEIYEHTTSHPLPEDVRMYLLAGEQEGNGSVVADVNQMESTLLASGVSPAEVFKKIDADGEHSEWYWAREFPAAYKWLFGDLVLSDEQTEAPGKLWYPNPVDSLLFVEDCQSVRRPNFRMYDLEGKKVLGGRLHDCSIDVSSLPAGVYVVQLRSGRRLVSEEKIMVK